MCVQKHSCERPFTLRCEKFTLQSSTVSNCNRSLLLSTFGKGVQQPTRTRPRHRLHRSRRCRPPDPPPPSSSSPLLSPPPSPRSSLHDEKGTSQANSSQFPPQDARSVHWVVARLWVAMAVALSHKRQLMAATYQGLPARCLCLADARPPCLASSHVSVTRATATAESCPKVLSALPQAG